MTQSFQPNLKHNEDILHDLRVKQGYWQNLPFLIRRLIGQLDIVGQGTYCTDYEVRDNDVFVLNPQYTPNSME